MKSTRSSAEPDRRQWEKPELKKLGALRDIAGFTGSGTQSGPNSRASNHLS